MIRLLITCALLSVCAAIAVAQDTIIPRDVVELKCVEDPTLNGEYVITDTGLILMQYIGAIEVKGLTPQQASAKISRELVAQQILRTASITIRIKSEARPAVSVGGAVTNGGDVPWVAGLKLSDVLERARPSAVSDISKIKITSADGRELTADRTKTPPDDPILKPGDRVFVTLRAAGGDVTVLGAVAKPGLMPFKSDMTVSQAITEAGGYRNDADQNRVTVRFANGQQRVLDMNVPGSNIVLSPGDSVFVPQRSQDQQIFVRGAVAKPGLLTYRPGLTVSQVVREAAPVEGSRLDRVKILRKDQAGKTATITVNIAKVMSGEGTDEPLIAGDIVDVPYPGKSFGLREGMQVASFLLLLFWLLK
ncbi:MAG: SLBB domain-containing protein [Armatimonadota bacterium]|nr:SLBB domain-containing protein [Armatimonadota bacterium]